MKACLTCPGSTVACVVITLAELVDLYISNIQHTNQTLIWQTNQAIFNNHHCLLYLIITFLWQISNDSFVLTNNNDDDDDDDDDKLNNKINDNDNIITFNAINRRKEYLQYRILTHFAWLVVHRILEEVHPRQSAKRYLITASACTCTVYYIIFIN